MFSVPDCFIVGLSKAGTTTIADWLRAHPSVNFSAVKEPNFFSKDFAKCSPQDFDWYSRLFSSKDVETKLLCEASVGYFSSDLARSQIVAHNPKAKVLISLRNPVTRVLSLAQMYHRENGLPIQTSLFESNSWLIRQCFVADNLEKWIASVGSEQVVCVVYEDWTARPEKLITEISPFLSLEPDSFGMMPTSNTGGVPRLPRVHRRTRFLRESVKRVLPRNTVTRLDKAYKDVAFKKTDVPRELADRLWAIYENDIDRCEQLIGKSLRDTWRSQLR